MYMYSSSASAVCMHVYWVVQEKLCGMWGVSGGLLSRLLPWLRPSSLRRRLQSHLNYIYTVDWLVKVEGGPFALENKDLEMVTCIILVFI